MTNPYEYYNETVSKIGELNLEGNIIPHNWYKHITFESGKADLNAIIILSEIVYWYRPTIVKDETTGQVIGTRKKFKSDLLQRSYESFANQFGLTKRQASDAIKRLEKHGLLERVFRNFVSNGMKLSNVLFIDLNADRVREITVFDKPSHVLKSEGTTQNATPLAVDRQTNTEITQENTTERLPYYPMLTHGVMLIEYYFKAYKSYFGKTHPPVNEDKLKVFAVTLESVMTNIDNRMDGEVFTVKDMKRIIEHHFDSIVDNFLDNDGKIHAFIGGGVDQTPILRYADELGYIELAS